MTTVTDPVYVTPGDIVHAEMPYSEVMMHLHLAGKTVACKLITPHTGLPGMAGHYAQVQLISDQGGSYSIPVTTGEAGFYHDGGGWYYYPPATPGELRH